jgi:hypothetical protein
MRCRPFRETMRQPCIQQYASSRCSRCFPPFGYGNAIHDDIRRSGVERGRKSPGIGDVYFFDHAWIIEQAEALVIGALAADGRLAIGEASAEPLPQLMAEHAGAAEYQDAH